MGGLELKKEKPPFIREASFTTLEVYPGWQAEIFSTSWLFAYHFLVFIRHAAVFVAKGVVL